MSRRVIAYALCGPLLVVEVALAASGNGRMYNGVGAVLVLALMFLELA